MNLGADMMRDQAHDALAVGRDRRLAGIGQALRQPVDPEPPIGVEHHLDDRGIFQKARRWPAQAPCAACARRAGSPPISGEWLPSSSPFSSGTAR